MPASIVAAAQVRTLQVIGVDKFHIFMLNRPELTCAIARLLGVQPIRKLLVRQNDLETLLGR